MVMRMRRQTALGEVDAPPIEELATGRDSDEHRRVAVLGDADGRDPLRSCSRHAVGRPDSGWLVPLLSIGTDRTGEISLRCHSDGEPILDDELNHLHAILVRILRGVIAAIENDPFVLGEIG
jgi:hypothetical protein